METVLSTLHSRKQVRTVERRMRSLDAYILLQSPSVVISSSNKQKLAESCTFVLFCRCWWEWDACFQRNPPPVVQLEDEVPGPRDPIFTWCKNKQAHSYRSFSSRQDQKEAHFNSANYRNRYQTKGHFCFVQMCTHPLTIPAYL